MAKDHLDKTAFVSHHDLSLFTRMSFGMEIAPGTFYQAMDVLLTKVKRPFALVYLDEIVVFLGTPENRVNPVRQVLTL